MVRFVVWVVLYRFFLRLLGSIVLSLVLAYFLCLNCLVGLFRGFRVVYAISFLSGAGPPPVNGASCDGFLLFAFLVMSMIWSRLGFHPAAFSWKFSFLSSSQISCRYFSAFTISCVGIPRAVSRFLSAIGKVESSMYL